MCIHVWNSEHTCLYAHIYVHTYTYVYTCLNVDALYDKRPWKVPLPIFRPPPFSRHYAAVRGP